MRNILFYFGAGWKFYPLRMKDYSWIDHFVFVDALPNLAYYTSDQAGYEKSKDRDSFIRAIVKEAKKKGFDQNDISDDHLIFGDKKGRLLDYYINTTVQNALDDPILNDLIKKAKWVHIQGFNPFINGLKVEHCEGCLYNYSEVRKYSIKMALD